MPERESAALLTPEQAVEIALGAAMPLRPSVRSLAQVALDALADAGYTLSRYRPVLCQRLTPDGWHRCVLLPGHEGDCTGHPDDKQRAASEVPSAGDPS